MLALGIVVLVVSVIVERATTFRSAQITVRAGGDWNARDVRYAHEGGVPKWLSAVAMLAYLGIAAGVLLIVVALT